MYDINMYSFMIFRDFFRVRAALLSCPPLAPMAACWQHSNQVPGQPAPITNCPFVATNGPNTIHFKFSQQRIYDRLVYFRSKGLCCCRAADCISPMVAKKILAATFCDKNAVWSPLSNAATDGSVARLLLVASELLGFSAAFSGDLSRFFPSSQVQDAGPLQDSEFGILLYRSAFSFLTLNKFT